VALEAAAGAAAEEVARVARAGGGAEAKAAAVAKVSSLCLTAFLAYPIESAL
jgi:hypothetical protein